MSRLILGLALAFSAALLVLLWRAVGSEGGVASPDAVAEAPTTEALPISLEPAAPAPAEGAGRSAPERAGTGRADPTAPARSPSEPRAERSRPNPDARLGRVVDPHRLGVHGATVLFLGPETRRLEERTVLDTTRTNAEGYFTFPEEVLPRVDGLFVQAGAHVSQLVRNGVGPGQLVTLSPSVSVSGTTRARDQEQTAIPHVRITWDHPQWTGRRLSSTTVVNSDAHGRYRLAGLPQGATQHVAVRAGTSFPTREPVHAGLEDVTHWTLKVRVGPPVDGVVVGIDGQPAPQAKLEWSGMDAGTTDRNGRFRLFWTGQGVLSTYAKDTCRTNLQLLTAPSAPLELWLVPEAVIEGAVLDVAGNPVAGARVQPRLGAPRAFDLEVTGYSLPEGQILAPRELPPKEAATDKEGLFLLQGLAPNFDVHLQATHSAFAPSIEEVVQPGLAHQSPFVRLHLDPTAALKGRFTLGGRAARGTISAGGRSTATDGQGRFLLEGLTPGPHTVVARSTADAHWDPLEWSGPVSLGAGEVRELAIDLPALRVAGEARFEDGEPAADVLVEARHSRHSATDRTDAEGAFEIFVREPTEDRITLTALSRRGYAHVPVEEAERAQLVVLRLPRLSFRPMDLHSGEPVPEFALFSLGPTGYLRCWPRFEELGRYSIQLEDADERFLLDPRVAGYQARTFDAPSRVTDPIDLVLKPGATLTLELRSSESSTGSFAGEFLLHARSQDHPIRSHRGIAQRNGIWTFPGLPAGTYQLTTTEPGLGVEPDVFVLEDTQSQRQQIRLGSR